MEKKKKTGVQSSTEQENTQKEKGSKKEPELFPPKLTLKEKIKKMLPKIIGFLIIVGISAACSNIRFATIGHDFFMRFYNAAFEDEQDSDVTSLNNSIDETEPAETEAESSETESTETEASETESTETDEG